MMAPIAEVGDAQRPDTEPVMWAMRGPPDVMVAPGDEHVREYVRGRRSESERQLQPPGSTMSSWLQLRGKWGGPDQAPNSPMTSTASGPSSPAITATRPSAQFMTDEHGNLMWRHHGHHVATPSESDTTSMADDNEWGKGATPGGSSAASATDEIDGSGTAEDHQGSLRWGLEALRVHSPDCVLIVRKIKKLGFDSHVALREHFSRHGDVVDVHVAHSKTKPSPKRPAGRVKPATLGFVIMADPAAAAVALAAGAEQTVGPAVIEVQRFEPFGNLAAGSEETENMPTQNSERPANGFPSFAPGACFDRPSAHPPVPGQGPACSPAPGGGLAAPGEVASFAPSMCFDRPSGHSHSPAPGGGLAANGDLDHLAENMPSRTPSPPTPRWRPGPQAWLPFPVLPGS